MTQQEGTFTVPTWLYLRPKHRTHLEHIVREQETTLADVVTQIVTNYLDSLPPPPKQPEVPVDHQADIRKYRSELARLRAQQQAAGAQAPPWLAAYIAEIEAELRRLEGL